MSRRFRILLASACAALVVLLCAVYANHVRGEADRVRSEALKRYGGEVVTLVVATDTLEPGDVVSQSNVTTRDWLADLAPDGAVTKLDDVMGKEVSVPSAKGAPLTKINFRDQAETSPVPDGHVALTLAVNDKLGISRNVAQGSSLVAYAVDEDSSTLIAQDMQVLSQPPTSSSVSSAQITVSILPDDVNRVLSAAASGQLRLVVPADDVKDAMGTTGPQPPTEVPEEQETGEGGGQEQTEETGDTRDADGAGDR